MGWFNLKAGFNPSVAAEVWLAILGFIHEYGWIWMAIYGCEWTTSGPFGRRPPPQ
jgi:hypothetical protein